jgi:dephospho-CoA kinase
MADVEQADPNGIAVVEAALIIEAGAAKDFDRLIMVTCEPEQKITRYARRANVSLEAARSEVDGRSAAQLGDAEKASHAHYVIDNSRSLGETAEQVDAVWADLQKLAAERKT